MIRCYRCGYILTDEETQDRIAKGLCKQCKNEEGIAYTEETIYQNDNL